MGFLSYDETIQYIIVWSIAKALFIKGVQNGAGEYWEML